MSVKYHEGSPVWYSRDGTQTSTCYGPFTQATPVGVHFVHADGDDTPSYNRALREGRVLPVNAYNKETIDGTRVGSYWYRRDSDGCRWDMPEAHWDGYGIPIHPLHASDSDVARWLARYDTSRLVTDAVAQFAGDFDILTFLAELRQLTQMFRGVAHTLADTVSKDKAKLANGYMEARYGWTPFLGDIRDFEKALRNARDDRERLFHRRYAPMAVSFSESGSTASTNSVFYGRYEWTHTVSLRAKGCAISTIRPPTISTSLMATAWELTPFSFMLDWVYGIGGSLRALHALGINREIQSWLALFLAIETEGRFVNTGIAPGFTGNMEFHNTAYRRIKRRIPFHGSMQLKNVPTVGSLQMLDASMLVLSRVRDNPPKELNPGFEIHNRKLRPQSRR